MPPKKKPKGKRHSHTYRCADDVEQALRKYRAELEYDPGDNEVIDRAVRAFLRSKGYTEVAEREPRADV